jgi:hypothetical protein
MLLCVIVLATGCRKSKDAAETKSNRTIAKPATTAGTAKNADSATELPSGADRFTFVEYICGVWITSENEIRLQVLADRESNPITSMTAIAILEPRKQVVRLMPGDGPYVSAPLPPWAKNPVTGNVQLKYLGKYIKHDISLKRPAGTSKNIGGTAEDYAESTPPASVPARP